MKTNYPMPDGMQEFGITETKTHIYINTFRVKPELRGRGIGTEVMKQLQSARKAILLQSLADTREDARRLLAFYRRLGFKRVAGRYINGTIMEWRPEY